MFKQINENSTENKSVYHIYPNPFVDELNLEITSEAVQQFSIVVQDLMGKEVLRIKTKPIIGTETETIGMATAPPGIYFLTIQDKSGKIWSKKIIRH